MIIFTIIISFFLGAFFGAMTQKFVFNGTSFEFEVNEKKRPREADDYWHLEDGGNHYLFTESEVIKAKLRAQKNPEDIED